MAQQFTPERTLPMIIRREQATLVCIRQVDHAAMAAALVAAWRGEGLARHPRRDVILLATREHDNGWREEDEATQVDGDGEPLDFMSVSAAVKQRIWPRAVARLAQEDAYAAALVAQHALTVHGQQRSDPAWRGFVDTMERLKREQLRRSGMAAAALASDYRFVQAGDQLSLIFCNGWTAPFPRPGGRTILNGEMLEIAPDPFDGASVPIRVPARRLVARPFASGEDFSSALTAAPFEWLEGQARGPIR